MILNETRCCAWLAGHNRIQMQDYRPKLGDLYLIRVEIVSGVCGREGGARVLRCRREIVKKADRGI